MTSLPKDNPSKKTSGTAGEFSIIREIFAPLAKDAPGAFGLTDDAATLSPRSGCDLVLTKDTLIAGVHFLESDPPDLVARKALRVNLSDLAAKGADPLGYLLSCAWPTDMKIDFIRSFASGLAADQSAFGFPILGGDTVRTPGPLTLTVTAIGEVPAGKMLRRSGARPGDDLYVTGTIGDAFLGLEILQGRLQIDDADTRRALISRYQKPEPRVSLGPALREIAHGSIDVSDGLFADARHMAEASGVGIDLDLQKIPLSTAAQTSGADRLQLASGGDDYEILFTASKSDVDEIAKLASEHGMGIHSIGRVKAGEGLRVLDENGNPLDIAAYGYEH